MRLSKNCTESKWHNIHSHDGKGNMTHGHLLTKCNTKSILGLEQATTRFDDIVFEWDDEKEASNVKKHGIDFIIAARVFADPYRLEIYDEMHSKDEDRYNTIGMVENIIFVVYTQRNDTVRIISARIANKNERNVYLHGKN